MHEVLAPQDTTVCVAQLIVKYLLKLRNTIQEVDQTQLLQLVGKYAIVLQQR
jgi:hypothetical protein